MIEAEYYAEDCVDWVMMETIKDAVELYVEDCLDRDEPPLDTVMIQAYNKAKITDLFLDRFLDDIVESLNDEYSYEGDYDYLGCSEVTDAWNNFKEAVRNNFNVTILERVGKPFEVKVVDYVDLENIDNE